MNKEQEELIVELGEHVKCKEAIRETFPELFKEKLVVGKWYVVDVMGFSSMTENTIVCYQEGDCKSYGMSFGSIGYTKRWIKNFSLSNNSTFRLATDKEIEDMLTKEAIKRGFIEGVRFKSEFTGGVNAVKGSFTYNAKDNTLYSGGMAVFDNGKWAEIIKEEPIKDMTPEEIQKELGYKIRIIWQL